MATTATYDTPTRCTGGAAPGASALLETALGLFPGVSSGGIYSCRKTRVGSGLSEHAEGRAVDLMVSAKALGDKIANWAIRVPGVQTVIWWDRIWTSTQPTWRPYVDKNSGRPYASATVGHRDHVHIGLTRAAAGTPSTGSGTPVVPGIAGGVGNAVASVGTGFVDGLLEGLTRVLITGMVVGLGAALVVTGGYRAVTGRKLTSDAAKAGVTVATKGAL